MSQTDDIAAIRFGCGLPLADGAPRDVAGLLAALQGPDAMAAAWPIPGLTEVAPVIIAAGEATKAAKRANRQDEAKNKASRDATARANEMAMDGIRRTLARSLDATDGLRERLVAFWSNHFTIATRDLRGALRATAMTEDAIRPNLTGRFTDLLMAVAQHPAMLTYLDQASSTGPDSPRGKRKGAGLNENYARELLELHTMGSGYDQTDVRQLAELLTGLAVRPGTGTSYYEPRMAEPGAETVLGRSYPGETLDTIRRALDDISQRPETAAHIGRKLAVHFVSDTPDPGLVSALAAAWTQGGGALMPVYAALLNHPAAWAPDFVKARQPTDYLIAALRALGVTGADVAGWDQRRLRSLIVDPLAAMGQPWKAPRGPNGWPEEAEAWITPPGLAARITWAMDMPQKLRPAMPDPAAFAGRVLGAAQAGPVVWAAARAEVRSEGVGIVLASAAFNRR